MKHPNTPVETPIPPPPPRRTKSTGSTSPTTTSSTSHHRHRSLSAIPFSWEKHPGIAKQYNTTNSSSSITSSPLPPPPPMSKMNFTIPAMNDPFEVALNECARDPGTPPGIMEEIWGADKVVERRKKFSWRYHGTCKATWACSVSDSTVRVRQTKVQTAGLRLLNQRVV